MPGLKWLWVLRKIGVSSLMKAYINKMPKGKPFVTLRYTISRDGKILDQLGEGVTESGGYYSKLLQEYYVIVHSSTTLTKQSFLSTSKEPKANQPLHVLVAKSPAFPIQVPSLPSDTARKAIIFTDADSSANIEAAQMGIETVVTDEISLDAILEYCKNQGACSVLINLRGNSDDLEEILKVAWEKKQVEKLLVEVSPFGAGPRWKVSSTKRMLQKIGLNKLSSKKIEGGYSELYGSDQFNIEVLASLFRQAFRS
ncbi:Riboflavin biosynthesis protein PYRD, chloroplastic-like protein [Drosera capensis]